MKQSGYIGLDVGTSGCKASVLNAKGQALASARREYRLVHPGSGMVELDPDVVWRCVKETLREIGAADCEPRTLAVSSLGEAMVMVDEQDRVIRNGITYLDERGPETMDRILEKFSAEQLLRMTGLPLRIFFSLNRYLWLCGHEPEHVERTRRYFLIGDYITYMLTGERMIDHSLASRTLLLDVMKLDWSREIGDAFGVPLDRFSRVVPTGTVAGTLRPALAEELGLSADVQVVVGCHDQCSATLGAGCVGPGDLAAGEGSAESLNLIVDKSSVTEKFFERRMCLEPYVQPGQYMVPVGQFVHGTSIRWFLREFGADFAQGRKDAQGTAGEPGKSIYELADENCAADSGDIFFLPYLTSANLMDADNRALGTFLGLKLDTDRAQMYRALLEGLCFESRLCFDILSETGFPIHRMVAAGGCSRSALLMQMKADVLGRPVNILKNADAGISALAMLGVVADGVYRDYAEAAKVFVETASVYQPQRDYSEKYRKYRVIQAAAKELYRRL